MTIEQFRLLPNLLHRSQVVAVLGIDGGALDDLRVDLSARAGKVPFGKIGAVAGLTRSRGRAGRGYYLYRKSDVARILGVDP